MKNILAENMRRFKTKNLNEAPDLKLDIEYLNKLLDPSTTGDMLPSTWMAKWFNTNITANQSIYIRKYNEESLQKFGVSLQTLLTTLDYVKSMKQKMVGASGLGGAIEKAAVGAVIHRGFPQIDKEMAKVLSNSGTRDQIIKIVDVKPKDIKDTLKNPTFVASFPNAEPVTKPKTDPREPRGKGYDADGLAGG